MQPAISFLPSAAALTAARQDLTVFPGWRGESDNADLAAVFAGALIGSAYQEGVAECFEGAFARLTDTLDLHEALYGAILEAVLGAEGAPASWTLYAFDSKPEGKPVAKVYYYASLAAGTLLEGTAETVEERSDKVVQAATLCWSILKHQENVMNRERASVVAPSYSEIAATQELNRALREEGVVFPVGLVWQVSSTLTPEDIYEVLRNGLDVKAIANLHNLGFETAEDMIFFHDSLPSSWVDKSVSLEKE